MYANYGMGFYNRQPNLAGPNSNMFIPGMIPSMMPRQHEVAYNAKKNLERVKSFFGLKFKKIFKRTQDF